MTVRECYNCMGADYEDVLRRLKSEERIRKFLGMLLRDDSFQGLCAALEERQQETAFRCVHTLKGVLLNLSLTRLARQASDLTEALRAGQDAAVVEPLFAQLKQGYLEMRAAVSELLELPQEGGSCGGQAQ